MYKYLKIRHHIFNSVEKPLIAKLKLTQSISMFQGKTNIDLLMKCCRADGLIIKPSRALTSTNQNILKLAFPNQIPGMSVDCKNFIVNSFEFVFGIKDFIKFRKQCKYS